MSEVYLVVITTGEWEDVRDATLGAFLNKPDAVAFAVLVREELEAMGLSEQTASFTSRWYYTFEVAQTGAKVGVAPPIPLAPTFTPRRKRVVP